MADWPEKKANGLYMTGVKLLPNNSGSFELPCKDQFS